VRTIPVDKRNGKVIGLAIVDEHSNILLIDQTGKIIRLSATEIRTMGRQAKGVRLIRLDEGQVLSSICAFSEKGTDLEKVEISHTASSHNPEYKTAPVWAEDLVYEGIDHVGAPLNDIPAIHTQDDYPEEDA
jgi:hypothetical protein